MWLLRYDFGLQIVACSFLRSIFTFYAITFVCRKQATEGNGVRWKQTLQLFAGLWGAEIVR